MPKPARQHNRLGKPEMAFAMSYAQHENMDRAATAAGWTGKEARERAFASLADKKISTLIVSHMRTRDAFSADILSEVWGLAPIADEADAGPRPPTLIERIQAARERLALAARGGLPPPSELIITRPALSRRKARAARQAAQHQPQDHAIPSINHVSDGRNRHLDRRDCLLWRR